MQQDGDFVPTFPAFVEAFRTGQFRTILQRRWLAYLIWIGAILCGGGYLIKRVTDFASLANRLAAEGERTSGIITNAWTNEPRVRTFRHVTYTRYGGNRASEGKAYARRFASYTFRTPDGKSFFGTLADRRRGYAYTDAQVVPIIYLPETPDTHFAMRLDAWELAEIRSAARYEVWSLLFIMTAGTCVTLLLLTSMFYEAPGAQQIGAHNHAGKRIRHRMRKRRMRHHS